MERVTGIEPVRSAWEADRLPLHHTRVLAVIMDMPLYDVMQPCARAWIVDTGTHIFTHIFSKLLPELNYLPLKTPASSTVDTDSD